MACDAAAAPASPPEIGTQAMIVIAQYFVGEQPAVVREATAAIWMEHLGGYPEWAIRRAVSWWLGPDNKERRRRPQPGDIAERCQVEVSCIQRGRQLAEMWAKYRGDYPAFLQSNRGA